MPPLRAWQSTKQATQSIAPQTKAEEADTSTETDTAHDKYNKTCKHTIEGSANNEQTTTANKQQPTIAGNLKIRKASKSWLQDLLFKETFKTKKTVFSNEREAR